MWNRKKSVMLSLIVCFVFAALLLIMLFALPQALELYYRNLRGFTDGEMYQTIRKTMLICFYPCAVFAGGALVALIRLLLNIRAEQPFILANVQCLFVISWCCYAIALITLLGGWFYLPLWIVTIAAAFIGLIVRVVKNVMHAAVALREDNDLTI